MTITSTSSSGFKQNHQHINFFMGNGKKFSIFMDYAGIYRQLATLQPNIPNVPLHNIYFLNGFIEILLK